MVRKADWMTGQIPPGNRRGRTTCLQVSQTSGEVTQVSVVFSGSSAAAKKSTVKIDYDGTTVEYPSPFRIKSSHGASEPGATVTNVIAYSKWDKAYGYYLLPESSFANNVTVILENGDDLNNTNYEVLVIYDT